LKNLENYYIFLYWFREIRELGDYFPVLKAADCLSYLSAIFSNINPTKEYFRFLFHRHIYEIYYTQFLSIKFKPLHGGIKKHI